MVGCFEPLIAPLQAQMASLTIFERSGDRAAGVEPAERALDLLPACSVAIITSTTLITEGLDALLKAVAGCREVALLGPSTPLLPEVFADTPVTWLSEILRPTLKSASVSIKPSPRMPPAPWPICNLKP